MRFYILDANSAYLHTETGEDNAIGWATRRSNIMGKESIVKEADSGRTLGRTLFSITGRWVYEPFRLI